MFGTGVKLALRLLVCGDGGIVSAVSNNRDSGIFIMAVYICSLAVDDIITVMCVGVLLLMLVMMAWKLVSKI